MFFIKGRISRQEMFYTIIFCIGILFFTISYCNSKIMTNFDFVVYIVVIIVSSIFVAIMSIKRLHDLGKSGLEMFWHFLPLLGSFYLFVLLLFEKGNLEKNKYGPVP